MSCSRTQHSPFGEAGNLKSSTVLSHCSPLKNLYMYGKCSKISNTSCLPKKRLRQTGQTQIRLLLEKQSDQGLPCFLQKQSDRVFPVCYCKKHFMNSIPDYQHFIYEQNEKSVRNFGTFTVVNSSPVGVVCR